MAERPMLMIVDDNPGDVDLVKLALEEGAVDVDILCAFDGREASERLQQLGDADLGRLRLILLDLNMPRMDGRQLLRWLRADRRYSGVSVVVVTSSTVPTDREECVALGAQDFWVKETRFERFQQQFAGVRRFLATT